MPKPKLVLGNVPKEDKAFYHKLPREGLRRWERLRKDHPTPYIFVEYDSEELCKKAIDEINANPDNNYHATPCTDNRSSDSLDKNSRRTSKQSLSTMLHCVLCEKPAGLMCERCLDPYCSPDCQKSHWNIHRAVCRRMPGLIPLDEGLINSQFTYKLQSEESIPERTQRVTETLKSPVKANHVANMRSPVKPMTNGRLPDIPRTPEKVEVRESKMSPEMSPKPIPKQVFWGLSDIPRLDFPPNNSKVSVLFINNTPSACLFIRSHATNETFAKIMKTAKVNAQLMMPMLKPPEIGKLYLAPFLDEDGDDNWYRVVVKTFNPDARTSYVAYIDFGNTSDVPITNLREIPEELVLLPRVTFRVVLKGVQSFSNEDLYRRYRDELMTKSLVMKYEGEPQKVDTEVTLYEEGNKMSVNDFFNRDELSAQGRGFKTLKFTMDSISVKTFTVLENEMIFIQFDEMLNEGIIYFHLVSDVKKLKKMEMLATEIGEKSEVYTPQKNELCLAKFAYEGDEEMWYRVVVHEVVERSDSFLTYFIDYGNFGKVHANNIREMAQELLMECSLICATIEDVEKPWPPERVAKFKKFSHNVLLAKKIEYKQDLGNFISLPDIVAKL